MGEPGDQRGAVEQGDADARAQPERDEDVGLVPRHRDLCHAGHQLRHRHAASVRPRPARSRSTPSALGTKSTPKLHSEPSTSISESSRRAKSVSAAVVASAVATIAPSMSASAAGGMGSSARFAIWLIAPMYELPRMLPTSPRAERDISESAGSTPSREQTVFALVGSNRRTTVASRSPAT